VAGAQGAAIHDAHHERADLARGDGHHDLVESGKAGRRLLRAQQRAPFDVPRQRHQIAVPETLAHRGRAGRELARALEISLSSFLAGHQAQEEAALGTRLRVLIEQTLGTGDPPAHLGLAVSPFADEEDTPDRAGGGSHPVAALQVSLKGTRARGGARLVETDQVGGGGQTVEIVPEFAQDKAYSGKVLRRAGLFGARKLQSDDPSERADDRVVEVVVSADQAPLIIGQRVLVKFKKI